MYKYMNKEYKTIEEMFEAWDKNGANRFYSVYMDNHRYECTYISIEQLDKLLKQNNNCTTFYKGNKSRGYCYRNASKIKIEEVDRIEIRNNRGIYGNITNALIVMTYNNKFVALT